MHPLKRAGLALAAVGLGSVGYGALVERNAFALRRYTVPVLPVGHRPLRVLHLADIHLMPGQRRKADWVRSLAELEPDLVVNTGDNIAHPHAVAVLLTALEPLLEVPGVFVLGSNDYFAPTFKNPVFYLAPGVQRNALKTVPLPTAGLVDGMRYGGWLDLTNSRGTLGVAGSTVEFVGVDDPHLRRDRYHVVAGLADPSADLTIGVTHAPYQRVLDPMTADGAGLILAGHTHGGQLCVPFYGALVTNCDIDRRRAKGLSRWWPGAGVADGGPAPQDASWLEVSAGLGTSPYAPVRFACRPEASLLTLVPR